MRGALVAWFSLSALGVAVISLPDRGGRLFSVSDAHGPSAVDMFGIALLLLGWSVFLAALWRARRAVAVARLPVLAVVVPSAVLLGWSVLTDTGAWWVVGALGLVAVQVHLARSTMRDSEGHHSGGRR